MSTRASNGERERFDFETAKARLAESRKGQDVDESVREIFAARARLLARPARTLDQRTEHNQLGFMAGSVRFCVALSHVRTVFVPTHVAIIPGTPVHLCEVIHFDGRIVSLFDLALFLGLPAASGQAAEAHKVVVIESRGSLLGFRTHQVLGLVSVDAAELAPSVHAGDSAFILGIARDMTLVLDAHALVEGQQGAKISPAKGEL